ncbi:MAG TPA: 16S rRNA (adenine(1518)-N(6)/adenine(1519)-N(6))-dimethyltransferase RsmA [Hyphomicrobiaceae bacterium]|nr:16S rRNA (adenine(1518)-N(6)/adenine(1519)-N(6))-dimethyltransferase RsmA [Hyphomicrobiaceae bacterium]
MSKRSDEIEREATGNADLPPRGGQSPDGLPPLRDVIAAHDLAPKKSLGQNFLLDLNLTRKLARAAGPLQGRTVVEIGPGPGGLTRALLLEGASRVIAVERDERAVAALGAVAARYPGRLEIVAADALAIDWLRELARLKVDEPVIIAANLPYNIATKLLVGWLESEPWPAWFSSMSLMFQKEVAERIVASPGTKAYGRLAVIAQWRAEVHIGFRLGPEAFSPPPKVASAVVHFTPRPAPSPACSVHTLGRVTQAAFGQRRKMLRQSLKSLVAMPELLLRDIGIAPEERAERLSVAQFAMLANLFDRGAHQ